MLIALAVVGCAKAPAPSEQRTTPSGAPQASAAPVSSASAAALPARFEGDGCHAGLGVEGEPSARATRIAEACAPGSKLLGQDRVLPGPGEIQLELDAAGCVRVVAVAASAGADLTLDVVDEKGELRSTDVLPGPVALAGPKGPLCLARAGKLTAKLGFARGSGAVAVSARRM